MSIILKKLLSRLTPPLPTREGLGVGLLLLLFCTLTTSGRSLYYNWTDMHQYNGTMTVTARVLHNGQPLLDCELAAFDENDELRGSAVSHPNDGGIIFLTIQGDNRGAELHFRVVHGTDDENRTITDADETLVFVADQALGTYTVPQVFSFTTFVKGDANGDGVVNVTDIMAVANYILKIQMQTFVEAAADVNGDNSVNVTDIMGIANIILKVTPSSNSRATSEVDAVEPQ